MNGEARLAAEPWVRPPRVRFGHLWVDALSFDGALAAIERLVDRRAGGVVFTPNVDHVVVADGDPRFREAYRRADVSLCDGQPLRWASGMMGLRLPAKVSGSDLFLPLMRLAARRGYRVFLFGGAPGVAEAAAEKLRREEGVLVVGTASPRIGLAPEPGEDAEVERVAAARPDLLLVCLGGVKAEIWIDRVRDRIRPAVALGIGASLDFYVGRLTRAPRWMQRAGLEWLYRLLQEPRRLARRYLVQDPKFLLILLRTWRAPRAERVLPAAAEGG
jgi:N-acetylglucosaminyldiphosphoundecaprenol N-acetyl-beta-D-mannosaminyltransferase